MRTRALVMFAVLFAGAAGAAGQAKLINPAGQEASDLVKEVMKKYGIEQGKLAFRQEGTWVYASETSAVVAMETTERAKTTLEYGETAKYGKRLKDDELHYIHIFHIQALTSDTTYHFRMSAVDRNGGRAAGKPMQLRTKKMTEAVRIPGDLEGPPYELNKRGATYLVTKDITAPKTAFNVSVGEVTLDLGGHTVVYNEEHLGLPTNSFNNMLKQSAFGVRVRGRGVDKNVRILNGILKQGRGNDEASYGTIGFNPIYLSGGAGSEIAGVTCIYSGTQMSGIMTHWCGPGISIHHNVVQDKGNLIANRHRQNKAIVLSGTGGKAYNNLVKRTRHVGIGGGARNAELYNNEVHADSYAINGGGVGAKAGSVIHHNRIFACGSNVVAMATTGGSSSAGVKIHDNYVWLHAHDIVEHRKHLSKKPMESTRTSVMSGVRITWGCVNPEYHRNVILMTARDGGIVRGTFFFADAKAKGAVFRDNLVIAIAENEKSGKWGAIGGVGSGKAAALPIEFTNNTIVSNFANFSMQDTYGTSSNYRFVGCKFVRVGDRGDYATIKGRRRHSSGGHVFLDTEFEGGAGFDKADVKGRDNFAVKWTLAISAPPGARVSIKDKNDKPVFSGNIPADGKLAVPLTQYVRQGGRTTPVTPHTITVSKNGKTATRTVEMDGKKDLRLAP